VWLRQALLVSRAGGAFGPPLSSSLTTGTEQKARRRRLLESRGKSRLPVGWPASCPTARGPLSGEQRSSKEARRGRADAHDGPVAGATTGLRARPAADL